MNVCPFCAIKGGRYRARTFRPVEKKGAAQKMRHNAEQLVGSNNFPADELYPKVPPLHPYPDPDQSVPIHHASHFGVHNDDGTFRGTVERNFARRPLEQMCAIRAVDLSADLPIRSESCLLLATLPYTRTIVGAYNAINAHKTKLTQSFNTYFRFPFCR